MCAVVEVDSRRWRVKGDHGLASFRQETQRSSLPGLLQFIKELEHFLELCLHFESRNLNKRDGQELSHTSPLTFYQPLKIQLQLTVDNMGSTTIQEKKKQFSNRIDRVCTICSCQV